MPDESSMDCLIFTEMSKKDLSNDETPEATMSTKIHEPTDEFNQQACCSVGSINALSDVTISTRINEFIQESNQTSCSADAFKQVAVSTIIKESTQESNKLSCSSTDTVNIVTENSRDPAKIFEEETVKFFALTFGPYQPKQIDFPKRNNRKFRTEWYNDHEWLEYSPSTDAAYCFSCRAFPSGQAKSRKDQVFVSAGFNNWKKAAEKFREHHNSLSHKESHAKFVSFKSSKTTGSVVSKIDKHHEKITSVFRK